METKNGVFFSRRTFIALAGIAGCTALTSGSLVGCGSGKENVPAVAAFDPADWDALLEEANGQTVTFYGWGGDENRNEWLDTVVAETLKDKYGITLERVPMNINDILTKLSGEIQADVADGSIDFIWINGENFYSAKDNGYLYGPFTEYLPNFVSYVDAASAEVSYDFGEPVEGYEAPYGKAQMLLWVDAAKTPDMPTDAEKFLAFCKEHPGQVTYPAAGDFTGTAFISCLIAAVIGKEEFEKLTKIEADIDKIKEIIEPGLEYLRSLNPYLWQEGKTFPADSGTVSQMFADGELVLNMGYSTPQLDMDNGVIPATVRPFLLDNGTVGNTNFMAIAKNASHKAAAMVAINEILSPEIQASQYEMLTTITVLDTDKLDSEQKAAFDDVVLGDGSLPLDEMLSKRIAEASGVAVPLIEELWTNEVVGK
ncbi:MAG: ABC transporter substrate-binding protein [Actinobacteria bacterium]|nr:ABC transporter substrate-binding protein [Actinomycetota bacterium]